MTPVTTEITTATVDDLNDLADVAARTFPLACPPSATTENIASFVAEHLSAERFADYLTDPDRSVLVAREQGRVSGYAMLIRGVVDDADVQRAVTARPAVELSKMYVSPDAHGGGVARALMTAAIHRARNMGSASVWLGVNQENRRAQKFYSKHGFLITGTKTFRLGEGVENDYVMTLRL